MGFGEGGVGLDGVGGNFCYLVLGDLFIEADIFFGESDLDSAFIDLTCDEGGTVDHFGKLFCDEHLSFLWLDGHFEAEFWCEFCGPESGGENNFFCVDGGSVMTSESEGVIF